LRLSGGGKKENRRVVDQLREHANTNYVAVLR